MPESYCSLSDAEAQFDGGRFILYLYNLQTPRQLEKTASVRDGNRWFS